ncbi:DUF1737 domain-containing protein [Micromonospora sp. M12]
MGDRGWAQASGRHNAAVSDFTEPLGYRLITGPDDAEFCARVSALLDQGYQLYGSPALTFDGERVIAARVGAAALARLHGERQIVGRRQVGRGVR